MGKWSKGTIATTCQNLDRLRIPISGTERSTIQGDIPYYGANGQVGYIDDYLFDEPLILIAEDGGNFEQYESRPIAYRISGKSWVNNHAHILKALPNYDQDYIFYSLEHANVLYYIAGGTRSKLTQKELSKIEIIYPEDIKEQHKIAKILATIDEAIDKTKTIIEKYKAVKEGLMQDLLANGIDENGVIRSQKTHEYKDSPLGKIPVEWKDTTVKLNFKLRARIGWQGLKASEFIEDGPFVVTGTDFELGKINWDNCYHVSYKRYEQDAGIQLHDGDLVITKDGTIGKTAFITDCPPQTTLNSGVFVIRPKNNDIFSKYFYYILNSRYFEQFMRNYLTGSTIKHLNQEIFYDMVIVVPKNIDEQKRIVNKLDSIQNAIYKEIEQLKKYNQIKHGLMQDLLTYKVSVDPLLERSVENE